MKISFLFIKNDTSFLFIKNDTVHTNILPSYHIFSLISNSQTVALLDTSSGMTYKQFGYRLELKSCMWHIRDTEALRVRLYILGYQIYSRKRGVGHVTIQWVIPGAGLRVLCNIM